MVLYQPGYGQCTTPFFSYGTVPVCPILQTVDVTTFAGFEGGGTFSSYGNITVNGTGSVNIDPSLQGGIYEISYTPSGSCSTLPGTATITVSSLIHVSSLQTTTICSKTLLSFDLTSTTPGAVFRWYRQAATGISPNPGGTFTGSAINETLINTNSSNNIARYVITPYVNGCEGIPTDLTVTIKILPSVTGFSVPDVCSGLSFVHTISGAPTGWTFNWNRYASSGLTNPSVFGLQSLDRTIGEALYNNTFSARQVRYELTPYFDGCAGSFATVTGIVRATPNISSPLVLSLCGGNVFNYTITSNVAGTQFNWLRPSNPDILNPTASANSSFISESLQPVSQADLSVSYIITPSGFGCIGTPRSLDLTLLGPPAITSPAPGTTIDGLILANNATILGVSVVRGNILWQKSFDLALWEDINNAFSDTVFSGNINTATAYRALITNGLECETITSGVFILYPQSDALDANFTIIGTGNTVCSGNAVEFFDLSFSVSTITSWIWDFGPDATPTTLTGQANIESTFFNYSTMPRQVNVKLKVYDSLGNVDSLLKPLTIYPLTSAPTIIYPGGNGILGQYCNVGFATPIPNSNSGISFFSSDEGIDIRVDGVVNLENSVPDKDYTVLINYSVPGCGIVTGALPPISINKQVPPQFFSYGNRPLCTDRILTPLYSSLSGGVFNVSSLAGFKILDNGTIYDIKSEGTFTIYYTVPAPQGCESAVSSTTITLVSPPVAPNITYDESALGYENNIWCAIGQIRQTSTASGGVFSYLKLYGEGDLAINKISGNIDLSASAPGRYIINYQIPSDGFCDALIVSTETTIVSSIGGQPIITTQENTCEGSELRFYLEGITGNILVWEKQMGELTNKWQETAEISEINKNEFITVTQPGGNIYYRAKVKNENCPEVYSGIVGAGFAASPIAGQAITTDEIICNDPEIVIRLRGHKGQVTWQVSTDSSSWEIPRSATQSKDDSLIALINDDEYNKEYYFRAILNSGTCESVYSNTLFIRICDKTDLIPNVLTPNTNDGNSAWHLENYRLRDGDLVHVYNRYGAEVYFATGRQARTNPWSGGNLPAGTYYYVIDKQETKEARTGALTIIK